MTYLDDVLDVALLGEMLDQGYVQVRYHPDYPYAIYCYTKQAMFDRKWNDVTKICRGLIVNEDTSEVLARPFKKFFNLGEPDAPVWGHTDWVTIYDKVDGSLGIAYDTPDGPAIATKGSFTSEQALFATELLRGQYERYFHDDAHTDLFEIIYPENRIVLDYGDTKELRYLGSIDINNGTDYWNGMLMRHWGIPTNHFMLAGTYVGILDAIDLERPNAEGVVLFNEDTGERLKLKQEDYLELHKVMTGLNERQLWQWLTEGKSIVEILSDLPEEIHDWATPILAHLVDQFLYIDREIHLAFKESQHLDRKEFALFNQGKDAVTKGALFAKYDDDEKRLAEIIWKAVRP